MRKKWQRFVAGMVMAMLAIAWWPSSSAHDTISDRLSQFPLRSHPLPEKLAGAKTDAKAGNYFDEIQTTQVEYLIWSQFPVRIHIAATTSEPGDGNSRHQNQRTWYQAVVAAIEEWQPYFPLTLVETPENADIRIWNRRPPLKLDEQGRLLRARAGQVKYKLYLQSTENSCILSHRFDIFLNPNQAPSYLRATIRHELGHALGIWGHSSVKTDTMYFSQVQNSSPISERDINTLRRIYQQPTRLGWSPQS
jgi:predicted Zn-dependent protease